MTVLTVPRGNSKSLSDLALVLRRLAHLILAPPIVTSSAGVAPALPLSIFDPTVMSNDARSVRACYEVRL